MLTGEAGAQFIAHLSELTRNDALIAGGKGANLGELTRAGVPVPPGFVVTAPAYDHVVDSAGIRPALFNLLGPLDIQHGPELDHHAGKAQSLFGDANLCQDIIAAIETAYLGLGARSVAVRSSATNEDGADASFAGQQSTFLNVQGEAAVLAAVRQCWASLFEPRAIHYRAQNGFGHESVSTAVVVQQMVNAERSGVMFTANPVTGDGSSAVIEAAYGLGEALVSGLVTPDTYVVDKHSGGIVERAIGAQEQEIVPADGTGEETSQWAAIEPERGSRQKLNDDEIAQLVELGRQIEDWFGSPQDIEWAIADGAFHIVQSRPITTL